MMSTRHFSAPTRQTRDLPKPAVQEFTLTSDEVRIERKTFVFALKQNHLGRFLRVTEESNGRCNTLIIPASGLEEFTALLCEMAKTAADLPAGPEKPGQ